MRIGIYTRKDNHKLPTIEWLIDNGFNAFEIYEEDVMEECNDIAEREALNMLIYDGQFKFINAVYVHDLSILSTITIKILQALIELQKVEMPVYHKNGCIKSDESTIRIFQDQIFEHWEIIKKQSQLIKLIDEKENDT